MADRTEDDGSNCSESCKAGRSTTIWAARGHATFRDSTDGLLGDHTLVFFSRVLVASLARAAENVIVWCLGFGVLTRDSGSDRGSRLGQQQGQRQGQSSAAGTAPAPPAPYCPQITQMGPDGLIYIPQTGASVSQCVGLSIRHVMARTSSKSCKAVVAFPRCTAPETLRSLRWQSTSFAEA